MLAEIVKNDKESLALVGADETTSYSVLKPEGRGYSCADGITAHTLSSAVAIAEAAYPDVDLVLTDGRLALYICGAPSRAERA